MKTTETETIAQAREWIDKIREYHKDSGPNSMSILTAASVLEEAIDEASPKELAEIEALLASTNLFTMVDSRWGESALKITREALAIVFPA